MRILCLEQGDWVKPTDYPSNGRDWLGQGPRPPFPKGRVVEQGDWSLLDPVRARPRMYRVVG
jgi:hypothetical protein